jgi:hypothetical protein
MQNLNSRCLSNGLSYRYMYTTIAYVKFTSDAYFFMQKIEFRGAYKFSSLRVFLCNIYLPVPFTPLSMVLRITLVILLLAAAHAKIVQIGSEPISDSIYPVAECDRYEQNLTSTANSVTLNFRAASPLYVRVSNSPCSSIENYVPVSPNSTLYRYMYADTRLTEQFNFTAESTVICASVCYRGAYSEFDIGGIGYTLQLAVIPQDTNPTQNITQVVQQVNQLSRVVETTQAAQAASAVQNTDQDQKINLLEYGFIALACVTVILMGLVIYLLVRSPKPQPPMVMSSVGSIPAWQA